MILSKHLQCFFFIWILFLSALLAQTNNNPDRYELYQKLVEKAEEEFTEDSLKALETIQGIELEKIDRVDSNFINLAFSKLNFLKDHFAEDKCISEARNIIRLCNDKQANIQAARIHNFLTELFLEINELDSSNYHLSKALEVYRSNDLREEQGELLLKRAIIQYSQSQYIQSIETVFEAVENFKVSNQDKQLAFAYLQIGSTYLYINFLDKAEEYYQLAGKHFLSMEDSLGFAICNSNLGLIELERENYAGAIDLLKTALVDLIISKRQIMIAFAYQSIGECYLKNGQIDSAIRYTHLAHEIDKKLEYSFGMTKDYYLLAQIKKQTGQPDSALYFAEKSFALLEIEPDLEIDYDLSLLLADMYSESGQYIKSNEFLRRRISVMDSLDKNEIYINELSQVENLKLKETEFALKISKETEKLKAEENEHQKDLIILLTTILVLFVISLIIVLIINKKKKTLNQKLKSELSINQSLLKEIHHRVKNNLQIIASMLNMQSQYLNDDQIKRVLFECRGRINSMALIHESLYRNESMKSPLFSDYIRNLIPLLIGTYKLDQNKIKLEMELEDFELSLDESVPCGLIINEVVSNSIKHAFIREDNGTILIKFFLENDKVKLVISDNGIGLPKDFDIESQDTFGFLLIHTLASQLEASLKIESNKGVTVFVEWEKDFMLKG